ncbi:MAG TPA: DUF1800 domain-containing protein [Stellaceae bacterium]|nr:DUF1800 domain-containing protein [Stellaceae bacterium]
MKLRHLCLLVVLCGRASPSWAVAPSDREIIHILNRLASGPTAADIAHVRQIGIDAYIAEQLNPQAIPESPELTRRLAGLDTLRLDPIQLFRQYGPVLPVRGVKATLEEQKARRQASRIIVEQARAARIYRALYSRRQLNEVMVDFWYNHFNVFAGKGLDHLWVGAYERDAIRPYALGHFRDLLMATAKSPAMLFYLDNWQNSAPGSRMPGGREAGINENYAREVMELHTLGVDGRYTQADVISLARILTGWGLARPRLPPPDPTGFYFDPARHDFGSKQFIGRTIPPGGESEGVAALDMLAQSPATAHHIAFELAQYFVSDAPPPALVDRLAARFTATGGDIKQVLAALFASPEFSGSAGQKYKTPYRYVLSAARAAGIAVDNPRPLLGMMARLGMPLYGCLTPDGYKNTESSWLSPEATTLRVSLAMAIAGGRLPLGAAPADGTAPQLAPVAAVNKAPAHPVDAGALETLLGPSLSAHTWAVIDAARPGLRGGLLLGSPDFMRE